MLLEISYPCIGGAFCAVRTNWCGSLTVLRGFRDNYLRSLSEGQDEIAEYYFVAPQIVTEIKSRADAGSVLNAIYEKCVLPCVGMIECGDNEGAHRLYRETVSRLRLEYL